MLFYLFLLFTVVPLIELTLLIRIGGATAWWVPLLLVITTGVVGAVLARWQGFQTLERIRSEARAGRVPAAAVIDGLLILLAGILLITPGVLTDLAGVLLLIPPIRALVKRAVAAWIRRNVELRIAGKAGGSRRDADAATRTHDPSQIIDVRVTGTRVEDAK